MEENFFWNVFEKTGNIESYLGYKESCDYEGDNKNADQNTWTDFESK